MNDNDDNLLMQQLMRLETKLDNMSETVSTINQRLASLEAQMNVQKSYNDKVDTLWSIKDQGMGIKGLAAWAVPLIISALALWMSYGK